MFSAAEMQLIRDHCPTDYDNLLRSLSIEIPDWSGDELRTFEDIDDRLTKKLCAEMKSESLFDGYTKLLKLGGVPYDYTETHHQLLGMVVANADKITAGINKLAEDHDSWKKNWGNASPEPEIVERLKIEVEQPNPVNLNTLAESFNRIKKDHSNYYNIPKAVNACFNAVKKLGTLFTTGKFSRQFDSVDEFNREIVQSLQVDDEITICMKISKTVEQRPKKIPQEPTKSPFTAGQIESLLEILAQADTIVKKI